MTRWITSLFLLPLALVAGCSTHDAPQVVEMEVQPYLVPCRLLLYEACMLGVENGGDTVRIYGMEGFTFEWDVRQTLRVEKRRYPEGVMDVPDFHHHARGPAVRSPDTAWRFTAHLYDTAQFVLAGDTLCLLNYPRPIRVADSADRARIADVARKAPLRFTVRPGGGGLLLGSGFGSAPRVPTD